MRVGPWDEILKRLRTPKQLAAIEARASRMILVEYRMVPEDRPWIALVHGADPKPGAKAKEIRGDGATVAAARRRARAALEAAVGKRKAIALWRERVETLPPEPKKEAAARRPARTRGRRAAPKAGKK